MRKRSTEIIQKIIKNNDAPFTVRELAAEYKISQKTLRKDIQEINQFLHTIPMPPISITEKGELIKDSIFDDAAVERHLYDMDSYIYRFSTEERQIYIMMVLMTSDRYVTMQMFARELNVSRVTIVNDMDMIKEVFKEFDPVLIMDPGKGMFVQCEENSKIEILTKLYQKIAISVENDGYFQRVILKRMGIQYNFSDVFSYAQEYVQAANLIFIEDVFYEIVLYMFVVFNFGRKEGRAAKREIELNEVDHLFLYTGYRMDIFITETMQKNFRQYIKEHGLRSYIKNVDEIELYKVIMKFVQKIGKRIQFQLEEDGKLIDALLMHIRNMKDWGSYEVELPTEYDSFIDYGFLEDLVEENAYILEQFLTYPLSKNMKKSMVIHICVALIRSRRYFRRLSATIVCPGSMATGKYLEAQLKNYFDFRIVGVLSVNEVYTKLEDLGESIDFVISTVPIESEKYPVIQVHPFLKMDDMNKIQSMVFQKQKDNPGKSDPQLSILKRMIQDTVEDHELAGLLCKKVEQVTKEYQNQSSSLGKNEIGKLLKLEFIQVEAEKITWQAAIRKAARPLEQDGYIEHRYTEKAIQHVKEYGDYIVVSEGVALAHANKDCGVIKDGLSLLVAKKGIQFTETKGKVYLLFCFASRGEQSYFHLLREIIQIGNQEDLVQQICQLNQREEIYNRVIGGI